MNTHQQHQQSLRSKRCPITDYPVAHDKAPSGHGLKEKSLKRKYLNS